MRNAQKTSLTHIRAANARIRLRGRAVWSGHSLPAHRIFDKSRIYQQTGKAFVKSGCAGLSMMLLFAVRAWHKALSLRCALIMWLATVKLNKQNVCVCESGVWTVGRLYRSAVFAAGGGREWGEVGRRDVNISFSALYFALSPMLLNISPFPLVY